MSAKFNLLVVSHEVWRTGAVHSLLRLLEWFRESGAFQLGTLCLRGGPHLDSFKSIGEAVVAKSGNQRKIEALATDVHGVLVNSAASAGALRALSKLQVPIILFVHELSHEISLLSQADRDALAEVPHRYIACSEAVAQNLQKQLKIPRSAITTLGELVSVEGIRQRASEADASSDIRAQLQVSSTTPLIGANGTPSWRKGVDLFLATAAAVVDRYETLKSSAPLPHFIWIGGGESPDERARIEYDIDRLGLRGKITFTGTLENPFTWMRELDVFCLTSREDPYPLVMLEAGILGVPIIGFTGSGGFDEFARDYGAVSVSPSTPGGMCDAIISLLDSQPSSHKESGSDYNQLDVSILAPRFRGVIEDMLSDASASTLDDAHSAAHELVRSEYPVEIRVIADKDRLSSKEVACRVDEPVSISVDVPQGEFENIRLRLSFHDGPSEIQISGFTVVGSDGKIIKEITQPVIQHSNEVADQGENTFTATGYHSRIYLDLPAQKITTVSFQLRISRVALLSAGYLSPQK